MTNTEAIQYLKTIEEDGRNVNSDTIKAIQRAINAFEFINDNFPKTFEDYLRGELE